MKSIKDFENKKGCAGKHTLSYGSLGEHQAEIMMQEQVESLEDDEEKSEQPEQKSEDKKEILVESMNNISQKK